jgi:hypothetical protein
MKIPYVRFTVRRMMIAVAITASGLYVAGQAISLDRRAIAQGHAMEMTRSGNLKGPRGEAIRAYHEPLRRKYERAAQAPWLPIEPD